MSSRPGSRLPPERARPRTTESSTAFGRSSKRKASGPFGKAREVNARACSVSVYRWRFHNWELWLLLSGRHGRNYIVIFESSISASLQIVAAVWRHLGNLRAAAEMVLHRLRRAVSTGFSKYTTLFSFFFCISGGLIHLSPQPPCWLRAHAQTHNEGPSFGDCRPRRRLPSRCGDLRRRGEEIWSASAQVQAFWRCDNRSGPDRSGAAGTVKRRSPCLRGLRAPLLITFH